MNLKIRSMKSLDSSNKLTEQGRAIARGLDELQTQKHKNMAKETKRAKTMLRNAAEKEMFN